MKTELSPDAVWKICDIVKQDLGMRVTGCSFGTEWVNLKCGVPALSVTFNAYLTHEKEEVQEVSE